MPTKNLLILGCGKEHTDCHRHKSDTAFTLDINNEHNPDLAFDISKGKPPINDTFDAIVLEYLLSMHHHAAISHTQHLLNNGGIIIIAGFASEIERADSTCEDDSYVYSFITKDKLRNSNQFSTGVYLYYDNNKLFAFIKHANDKKDTLNLSEILDKDTIDEIQKAVKNLEQNWATVEKHSVKATDDNLKKYQKAQLHSQLRHNTPDFNYRLYLHIQYNCSHPYLDGDEKIIEKLELKGWETYIYSMSNISCRSKQKFIWLDNPHIVILYKTADYETFEISRLNDNVQHYLEKLSNYKTGRCSVKMLNAINACKYHNINSENKEFKKILENIVEEKTHITKEILQKIENLQKKQQTPTCSIWFALGSVISLIVGVIFFSVELKQLRYFLKGNSAVLQATAWLGIAILGCIGLLVYGLAKKRCAKAQEELNRSLPATQQIHVM
jgi:hypothetical protein